MWTIGILLVTKSMIPHIEEAPHSLYVTAEWFQTPHGEVLLSIDRAVTAIHTEAAERGGSLTQKQTGNLQYVS